MKYKIEKRYSCDGGVRVRYWVVQFGGRFITDIAIEPFDTYEQAEQFIYELLMKE